MNFVNYDMIKFNNICATNKSNGKKCKQYCKRKDINIGDFVCINKKGHYIGKVESIKENEYRIKVLENYKLNKNNGIIICNTKNNLYPVSFYFDKDNILNYSILSPYEYFCSFHLSSLKMRMKKIFTKNYYYFIKKKL